MTNSNSYIGKQVGNYIIVAEVASGAFGSVYQGRHIIFTDRPVVAIKLLHAAYLGSSQESESFVQEARLLEKLKHPYSLPILDAGIHEGLPYLVAEYASNGSLRARLKRHPSRPLPVAEVLSILTQIGQALNHAHQQQIIHRDLKPENILFNERGEALLADFGIATVLKTSSVRQIDASGTPAYMAPEQFRGTISKESDQYSLGCVAYELVSGRQPFSAPDFVAMGFLHVTEAPVPPTQLNPGLPVHIEQAILKALAKQRTDRHVDVATFIRSLQISTVSEADILTVISAQEATVISTQAPTVLATQVPIPAQTSAPGTLQKTKEQWLDEGNAHFKAWHYREALAAFERANQLDPTFANAYKGKGKALRSLRRPQEALAVFERAIRLDPQLADAYQGKSYALYNLKREEEGLAARKEALVAYERAIRLDPSSVAGYIGKGETLSCLDRYEEALAAYEQAVRLDPNNVDAHQGKAGALWSLKYLKDSTSIQDSDIDSAYEKTLEAVERVIQRDPKDAVVYYNKSSALFSLKRYKEALAAIEQAIRLDPDIASFHFWKGQTLSSLKRYEEALAAIEQAIRLDPKAAYFWDTKSEILKHLGRSKEARQAKEKSDSLSV